MSEALKRGRSAAPKYKQVFIAEGRAGQTCRLTLETPDGPCKRRRALSSCQQRRARSLSPYLARVGGGYDYIYPKIPFNNELHCSMSAVKKPTVNQHAISSQCRDVAEQTCASRWEYDQRMLAEIIQQAEAIAAQDSWLGRSQVNVAHMLQAYQKVLPRHGIIAAEDTYYYRMVITLSLRPEADCTSGTDSGSGGERIPAAWTLPGAQRSRRPVRDEIHDAVEQRAGRSDRRHEVIYRSVSPIRGGSPSPRHGMGSRDVGSSLSPARHRSVSPGAAMRGPRDGSRARAGRERVRSAGLPSARMEVAAFQGWRAGARWKAGARQKVDRCSRRMQSLNKSRAFATWLERAQIRLDARQVKEQRIRKMRGYRMSKLFQSWSAARGEVLKLAVGRLRSAVLSAAFAGWVDFAARKAARKEAVGLAQGSHRQWLLRTIFRDWQNNASEDADDRMVCCWNTWMDGVEEGRTERIMLQRASAHWNAHKLRAALGQWRHELEGSKGLVQRATVICARLLNSVLAKAWSSWKDHVTLHHIKRKALQLVVA
ncbi:hypothetical protein WJX75_008650 [Coccomyxa subellipsoidea]|uniref:Sfi1 spindle body domain-containing protein n=1 Tax=Coccomyxa subellipsoidea TaxID=248742 RepID=A0ABR2YQC5_9CHLO